jgi:LSD1 subclass zinc finger protein
VRESPTWALLTAALRGARAATGGAGELAALAGAAALGAAALGARVGGGAAGAGAALAGELVRNAAFGAVRGLGGPTRAIATAAIAAAPADFLLNEAVGMASAAARGATRGGTTLAGALLLGGGGGATAAALTSPLGGVLGGAIGAAVMHELTNGGTGDPSVRVCPSCRTTVRAPPGATAFRCGACGHVINR